MENNIQNQGRAISMACYAIWTFKLNAPSTFIHLMSPLTLLITICCGFEDILIYSKNEDEHFDHVRQVLEVKENEFYVNLKKCVFLQK